MACFLVQFSVRENLLVVTGNGETKQLKDMIPQIISQVGPQQYEALKGMMGDLTKNMPGAAKAEDDEDDVPPLVGNFEDAAKK
jgi:nascent polypeptide-associated complex subunit beta